MIGVFVALDLFLFYMFWEIVLVPMYLIIGIWGGSNRIYATIKFVLYTLVGSLLMLVGDPGHGVHLPGGARQLGWRLRLRASAQLRATSASTTRSRCFAFLAFFLAFAIKVPMFPFHTWLPDAHVEAPTAGSVILAASCSSSVATASSASRVPLFPDAAHTFAPAIIVLSLIAIIYGAIVALVQPDLKKLVAYSSVSHMGFVTLGHLRVPAAGPAGRDPADGQPRPDHRRPVPPRRGDLRADPRPDDRQDGRARRAGRRSTPPRSASSSSPAPGCPGCPGSSASSWSWSGPSRPARGPRPSPRSCMILAAGYLLWMFQRIVHRRAVGVPRPASATT